MSARKGLVVLFKDVADEAVRRVMVESTQKNPEMPESEREQVAQDDWHGSLSLCHALCR